ncbi:MAG TPA: GNAT family N-acetyltransferase [Bacteroidetes bacterium]|nr:GNAT family N-acetyltransferase [Bacteroidota bacterium]
MNYHLRIALLSDLTALADHNQAMALETENRELSRPVIEAGLKAVLSDPQKGFYLVATHEDGRVAGNLMITFEWSDWRNAPMWWFQSVYIRPTDRGVGLFKKMYLHILEMARSKGVKEVRLYVDKTNEHAQRVYESLGMKQSHYFMYEIDL